MSQRREILAQSLVGIVAVLAVLASVSCSTIGEPAEEEPPECDCDPEERSIDCDAAVVDPSTGDFIAWPTTPYQILCIDEKASAMEREVACLDACEDYLVSEQGLPQYECDFPREEKYRWLGCITPGGTSSQSICPGWYSPGNFVSDYDETAKGVAEVTIESRFIESIADDLQSLYTCDTARYEESTGGDWAFVDVSTTDLLYELGIRNGDQNARVQGVDASGDPTTSVFELTSVEEIVAAHSAFLLGEKGVHLWVERAGAPEGTFDIWITVSS